MNMKKDVNGDYLVENEKYTQNPLNIVDTGYGLERIAWITKGTENIYESVFPKIVKWIKNNAKNPEDKQAIYSLADHTKSLSFMLGDGIVPSNVKAGYLARLLIRRALRFIKLLKIDANLEEMVILQLKDLQKDFPSLIKQKDQIIDMLQMETKRYEDTIFKGENLVQRIIQDKKIINDDTLIALYDTHGMTPSVVKSIAEKTNISVTIPDNFESMVAALHDHEKETQIDDEANQTLPESHKLYYENHYLKKFDAHVIWVNQTDNGSEIILNQTAFYPEGGGQPDDKGFFLDKSGKRMLVKQVYTKNGGIIHLIDGSLNIGDEIQGVIDWERRYILMKHHTGTHVVNGALRMILGEHIWQAGSQLGVNDARFDYAHYKNISNEELEKVEKLSNELVKQNIEVNKLILDRNTAEKKFGFRLYQGGVPPGNQIRVLDIPGVDAEACGGTHLDKIGEIEKIRIIRSERIQDGVNRIFFAAGEMVDVFQKEESNRYQKIINELSLFYEVSDNKNITDQLKIVSELYCVPIDQISRTIQKFLKDAKPDEKIQVKTLFDACNHLFTL
jgi:alanyl-tRNA synthetase